MDTGIRNHFHTSGCHFTGLLVFFLFLSGFFDLTSAQNRYVDPGGSNFIGPTVNTCIDSASPCETIVHAIDQASAGNTIVLTASAVFTESITIDKSLNVETTNPGELAIIQADETPGTASTRVVSVSGSGTMVQMLNIHIRHGVASDDGGGVLVSADASLSLDECIVAANEAGDTGGGIWNSGTLLIDNSTIFQNEAGNRGGGIHTLYNLEILNSAIQDNSTTSSAELSYGGGGIYKEHSLDVGSSTITLKNTILRDNSSAQRGGGLFSASGINIVNTIFYNNSSSSLGGAIYQAANVSSSILNSSFYGNSGSLAGGIYTSRTGSSLTLTNAVLWGNTNAQLYLDSSFPTINYSIVEGGCPADGTGSATCNSVLDEDPLFVDASAGNLQVHLHSPAINSGDPATDMGSFPTNDMGDAIDLDGNIRTNGEIDMGPYELQCPASGGVLYVAKGSSGDGSGWGNALGELRQALEYPQQGICSAGDLSEIWVASGVYAPAATPSDRNASFSLQDELGIYGGFAGTETDRSERNWNSNPTILTGNIVSTPSDPAGAIEDADALGNFSYSVVSANGTDHSAVLDGFIITGGHSSETSGILSDPDRTGGGIYADNAAPVIRNVVVEGNRSNFRAGGMYLANGSTPKLINVHFKANKTGGGGGGGLGSALSTPELVNVIFTGNETTGNGGGIFSFNSPFDITNCSFSSNVAADGGGLYNTNFGSVTLTNTVFWGNGGAPVVNALSATADIDNSIVQNGCPVGAVCNEIIDSDPLFTDAGAGNLRLQSGSPAVDAGHPFTDINIFPTNDMDNPVDPDGNPRFQSAAIDIGAYEFENLSVALNGNPGFRMLSSPVETNLADMLAPIWTQGMANSDHTDGSPNVWRWDNASSDGNADNWIPLTDLNHTIGAGEGVLVYVFDEDVFGTPGSWPKTLAVSGPVHTLPFSPVMNTNPEGFTLIGNPVNSSIDWNDMVKNDLDDVIYVWDQNDLEWKTSDGSVGELVDGIVRPFQSFFTVNSFGASDPSLEMNETTTPGEFYGKQSAQQSPLAIRLELEGEEVGNSTWLRFSDQGALERDRGDGLKLQSLTSEYALLATRLDDRTLLDINHLPLELSEPITLPLVAETSQPGVYTIYATTLNVPDGWTVHLQDTQTAIQNELTEGETYSFELNSTAEKSSVPDENILQHLQAKAASDSSRFMLTISPAGAQGPYPEDHLPTDYALHQNYPNPFNPVTVISYQLPENSPVTLELFDILGQRVAVLAEGTLPAGQHEVRLDASSLSSGVYIYRLVAGQQIFTKKLTLIK